jgi:acetyltransferase-like isoleucine patch superfamily enzyme
LNSNIEDFCIIKPETTIGSGAYIRSHTVIYSGNSIGTGFQTGHGVLIREANSIGDNVSIGSHTVIEHHVRIGNRVRIHSSAFIPEWSVIEDDVWIGPGVILTNAKYPASQHTKKHLHGVTLKKGVKIGAGAIILPGVTIGKNTLIGAGAVVTKDIAENSVIAGNPGRLLGKVEVLQFPSDEFAYVDSL